MADPASSSDQTVPSLPNAAVSIQHQSPPTSSASSISSQSSSETDQPDRQSSRLSRRAARLARPPTLPRQKSGSIIVPKENEVIQRHREYPPDDARAMSPRRNSHDLERIGSAARAHLKDQARILQSSLAALAERIDEVKSDHDRLESENRFLQDYIGGLTRTMSQRDLGGSSTGKGSKGKR